MISTMMDVNRPATAGTPAESEEANEIVVSERDSRLIIDLSGAGCTQEGARGAVEDLHTTDATLETAVTLVGMATEAVTLPKATGANQPGALDLTTQRGHPMGQPVSQSVVRSVKEEHLPRKKRRIDDVLGESPNDKSNKENGPPSSKIARREIKEERKELTVALIKKEEGGNAGNAVVKSAEPKPESNLVNSFVAKAMKIWYDEDLEASRNRGEEPKDLTCKETMPKTDSFVSSYPPGYPRPDDAHSHSSESSSYPFLKLKAMLRKKYANSLNEFSGDESTASQPSPPLPLQESSPNSPGDFDSRSSVIETKNGEKLFRCNVCFKAFTFSTNLTRHQRNIHGKPHRRRTKDFVTDKRMERRDSTGSDLSRPGTPDSRAMSEHSNQENSSNRSTPLSHLARPICNQCDMEFDNDELLELHNCDQSLDRTLDHSLDRSLDRSVDRSIDRSIDRTMNRSGHFAEPISFIQELTSKIEKASSHPLKSRCEDLMREENRRASFGGVPQYEPPAGFDRRLSMETGLVPPQRVPFENEKKFQIVLSENQRSNNPSPVLKYESDNELVPSPVPQSNLVVGMENEAHMWRFKCIECRLAFPTSKHLSKHLKAVHQVSIKDDPAAVMGGKEGQGNEHQCKECGKTFSQQAYLRRHMRNIHMKPQHLDVAKLPPQAPVPSNLNIVRNAGSLLIPGMTTIFCHLCGQTFSHPVHHYMHMAMSHGIMLQPDKDHRLVMPMDKSPMPHPAEPREADTAETRPMMGSLPSQLLPGGLIPVMPSYQFLKEKPSPVPIVKEEKRPAPLEGRHYQDNGLDLTKDKVREVKESHKENPMNLGELFLKKVVQEIKSPMGENSPKDLSFSRKSFNEDYGNEYGNDYRSDYGKENQENNIFSSRNIQNIQNINMNRPQKTDSPGSLNAERLMFPTHSDGKRHICGLCGASFTFQTNLTRHQRKLHGKPFVRRPSASQIFKQEATTT